MISRAFDTSFLRPDEKNMDFGGDSQFAQQLMGSSVANGLFLMLFLVIKCCKDRLKHSHCKSCCCEFDADMATMRSKRSNSKSSTTSLSKISYPVEKNDAKRVESRV